LRYGFEVATRPQAYSTILANLFKNNIREGNPALGNKRAQRALGRSPEKKVKGHSGANNREPQGII